MTKSIVACASFFLLSTSSAFAHNNRFFSKCPSCEAAKTETGADAKTAITIEEIPEERAEEALGLDASQLKTLYTSAHDSFETEEADSSYARKLIDKFNFKQIALNAYRWYGLNKTRPEVSNAAANITVMLLTSHLVETVGGLGGATYMALHPEIDGLVRTLVGVGGVVIVIPGLDPVCILLSGLYLKFPQGMNRLLEKPRVVLLKIVRKANALAGLPAGYWSDKLLQIRRNQMRARLAEANLVFEESDEGYRVSMRGTEDREIGRFELKVTGPGRVGLTALQISDETTPEQRLELLKASKAFGWNVSDWTAQVLKAQSKGGGPDRLQALKYVNDVTRGPDGLRVTTRAEAFSLPNACTQM